MDMQNRVGGKTGGGGVLSSAQQGVERKERLRQLALETIDLTKDPYFMRNHLGSYECKLCMSIHGNEGNYLAHTQGKRHQTNLARRAAMDAKAEAAKAQKLTITNRPQTVFKKVIRIGTPGYKLTKSKDPFTGQNSILLEVAYPRAEIGLQPRHRFVSAFEQKLPNMPIDKAEGKFVTHYDASTCTFSLRLHFLATKTSGS
eukprot:GSChrysophyteH1.ASY1.ANO1.1667.1 assembled CDS